MPLALAIALALVGAAIVGVPPAPSSAATVAPIRYVHDAAGRLVTVMDASGGVARYTYDATGNVLSIARSTAPALSVVDLSPRSAAVGARVSVIGRGFSTTPGQNTVRINGTAATVATASETELVVTVPTGATSGPVTVTTPAGTASGASLIVASSKLPTVSAVSPTKVSPGTKVTITGTNFSTAPRGTWVAINNTRAVVTSATPTTLTITVPDHVTTGRLSVGTA